MPCCTPCGRAFSLVVMEPSSRRHAFSLALFVILSVAIGSLVRARSMTHAVACETYEDVYYLPPPGWLRVFSLGWDDALADLLWSRALVYFGEEMVQRGRMSHVFDYTEAMLTLDPEFRAVYEWIGTAGLYRAQDIDAADAERAIEYLRRGHAQFPEDGELAWTLGAALVFELPPLLQSQEERNAARAEGAEYLLLASRRGAGPPWLALTSASLLSRVGRAEAGAQHLEEMYAMTQDEGDRARIAAGIAELRSSAYSDAFVEANREEAARHARELPYGSAALYFVVGPRPVASWRDAYRRGFAADVMASEEQALEALTRDPEGP